jgi:hypothetical protein
MTTKQIIDSILDACKKYIDGLFSGYTNNEKKLVAFEKENMARYSGGAAIDHVLFRKFLRLFDPDDIRNNLANHKQDKYDEGLKTADKTVVGGINEVYDSVPPFAFFEQNEDGTYTIVLPHKSVYSPASESGLYIEVSLPNECFEKTSDIFCNLSIPLSSGVEKNDDGEDTKTLIMYI